MGVDLMGIKRSYNWQNWHALYGLGVAFGWVPAGTLYPLEPVSYLNSYPPDDDPGRRGGYFNNDLYWVTEPDAAAWATALYRALDAIAGKSAMTMEQAEMVRKAITGDLGWTLPIKPEQLEVLMATLDEDAGGGPGLMRSAAPASPDIEDMVRDFANAASQHGFCIA
jgi:hypothetical protein